MTELPILYFHADDYGMTAHGDALIRDCQTHGCLNSVSIVPNGSLEEAVAALRPSGLKLAVHLNLVEGKALSPAAEIPLLVRPDGSFCNSFTGLLRLSLTPRRRAFAAQLYRELERQLLAYAALFPAGTPLRIDSHQHTHMIPLVFRTLLHILADHHLPVEHLRIPAEPLSPFVGCPRLWGSYSAVNAVKQAVLNGCWLLDRPAFRRSGIPTALFCGIRFSRAFGKEAALYAGLQAARGDCCVTLDCDLQHPVETIPEMYRLWAQGIEVVEGVKRERGTESAAHRTAARWFYGLISKAAKTDLRSSSDFKLLDRKAVLVLLNLPERNTFYRALSAWVGFRTARVEFDVQPRTAGQSSWSTFSLIRYAISSLASFTSAPLYLVILMGFLMLIATLLVGGEALFRYFAGEALEGFTTVILLQLFTGTLLMFSLGIIGYYLAKIYDEVKRRPRYVIAETLDDAP